MNAGQSKSFVRNFAPIPSTVILGREKEIVDITELLEQSRVVTITGTGGIGKTRLAVEICHRIDVNLWDNVFYLSMATLTDAKAITPTLANKLGVLESADRLLADGIYETISDDYVLLVIDNLEHVNFAATEIADLVVNCPNVCMLCTSRTPLKIMAEQEYVLRTLPLPDRKEYGGLLECPAIELFVRSAKKVNRTFEVTPENRETIVEICQYLDGLPLAIELAAFRLKVLDPDQLLSRLGTALNILSTNFRDFPLRHQTLENTIRWSHDLLGEGEKVLFRKLSVFKQSFSLEAVEQICYGGEGKKRCLEELSSLVDKGLVQAINSDARFTFLQTIKDFARKMLAAAEEVDSISMKHATYFHYISKLLDEGTQGKHQEERMNLGRLEDANIFAALDFLLQQAEGNHVEAGEMGLLICGNLWMYWHIKGKHQTTKDYVYSFLGTLEDQALSLGKCSALFSAHVSHFILGELEESKQAADFLLDAASRLNHKLERVKAYVGLAFGNMFFDMEQAIRFNEEATRHARKIKDVYWLGICLWQGGVLHLVAGNLDIAKAAYAEALGFFLRLNDYEGKGIAQSGLAILAFIAGDHDNALALYLDCLAAFKTVGDRPEQARILSEIAWVYLAKQDTEAALIYTLDSIKAQQEVGSDRGIGLSMKGLAAIEAARGRPKEAVAIAAAAHFFADQKGVAIEFGVNNHGEKYMDDAKSKLSDSEMAQAKEMGKEYALKEVLDIVQNYPRESETGRHDTAGNAFIEKLQMAIDAGLGDPSFGVNQLYEAVSMSQMQVYRKLKTLTNQTPSQFIRSHRLQKGKELLTLTDKTIAEIAYEVGFTDPNYFSKVFKKAFGETPKAYRS